MIGQKFIKISFSVSDANLLTSPLEVGHPALTAFSGFCESITFKTGLSFDSFSPFVKSVQDYFGNPKPSRVGPGEKESKLGSAKNMTLKLIGRFTGGVILSGGLLDSTSVDLVGKALADRRALGGHIDQLNIEFFDSLSDLSKTMSHSTFHYSLVEVPESDMYDQLDYAIALKSFVGRKKIADGVHLVNQLGFAKLHEELEKSHVFNRGEGFFVEPIMGITRLVSTKEWLDSADSKDPINCTWKPCAFEHGFYLTQEG